MGTADSADAVGGAVALETRPVRAYRGGPARWMPGRHQWQAALSIMLVLFLCYFRLSRASSVSGDGASIAVEAWAMSHGNWLLHGWTLTDVSFYTTELPQYAAIEALRGLTPGVVHIASAMTYTLLVLVAGWLAKGGATGRAGILRFLIASGIMLSPQPRLGAFILLLSPDHAGTMVPLLLIWLLIDRGPRRWWVAGVVGAVLAWVQVGDRLAATVGVLPLAVVCSMRVYQRIARRRGPLGGADPSREAPSGQALSGVGFELALGVAALASVPVAIFALRTITRLHGFRSQPLPTFFAMSGNWPAHLALTAEGALALFGADPSGQKLGLATALALVHLAGAGLAGWAVCRALRRFSHQEMVVQVLVVAIAVNVAAYVFSTLPQDFYSTREIVAVLPCGAVLAGRLLADRLARAGLLPVAGAVLLGYIAALGGGILQPPAPAIGQRLAPWLIRHNLTRGLSTYSEANPVTLASGGAVRLLQPNWFPGSARPGVYASDKEWFDPRTHYADFVVSTREDGGHFDLNYREVTEVFGRPAQTSHYRGYTIWVWHKNLLDDLR